MTITGIYYLTRLLVTLVAIPIHEMGHALASWLLGDPTARAQGRLSLNPLRHFDLLGTLCMVVAGVGWAKPVSIDPRRFKNPKLGMAVTALAGPAANLVLAYLSMARVEGGLLLGPGQCRQPVCGLFFAVHDHDERGAGRIQSHPGAPRWTAAACCFWCCPGGSISRSCSTKKSSWSSCWPWCGTAR